MTRKELERHREAIEAQIRWATLHDADNELLILLRNREVPLSCEDSAVY